MADYFDQFMVHLLLMDTVGGKACLERAAAGQEDLVKQAPDNSQSQLKGMKQMYDSLFGPLKVIRAPPQGPLDVMAGYKQIKGAHDCSQSLKVKLFLNLYAFLYLPRAYHRAYETVGKAAFECLKEFGAQPAQMGFELAPNSKEYYKATEMRQAFLAGNTGEAQSGAEMTPQRLQNLNKIIKFLE